MRVQERVLPATQAVTGGWIRLSEPETLDAHVIAEQARHQDGHPERSLRGALPSAEHDGQRLAVAHLAAL